MFQIQADYPTKIHFIQIFCYNFPHFHQKVNLGSKKIGLFL